MLRICNRFHRHVGNKKIIIDFQIKKCTTRPDCRGAHFSKCSTNTIWPALRFDPYCLRAVASIVRNQTWRQHANVSLYMEHFLELVFYYIFISLHLAIVIPGPSLELCDKAVHRRCLTSHSVKPGHMMRVPICIHYCSDILHNLIKSTNVIELI